jgi:hypothetical protein
MLVAAGAIALCVWQALLSRDSAGAHWGVVLVVIGSTVTAVVLGRRRQRERARTWIVVTGHAVGSWPSQPTATVVSALIWSLLIGATIGWDLTSFVGQSHALPTLSHFVGHVTRYKVGRGFIFALWLALGAYLAAGCRVERPPR